jgi:4-alpha-glucanotransferase
MNPKLDTIFYHLGIASHYEDYAGRYQDIPTEVRRACLDLMEGSPLQEASIDQRFFDLDVAPWLRVLPEFSVIQDDRLCFYLPETHSYTQLSWALERHGEHKQEGRCELHALNCAGDYVYQGSRYLRLELPLEGVPIGYYRLWLSLDEEKTVFGDIAVCPSRCFQKDQNSRLLGITTQLYTLRFTSNFGLGDFGDLNVLIRLAAQWGINVIGLNPLMALDWRDPNAKSPYAPSDRRFLNPIYLDLTRVVEDLDCGNAVDLDTLKRSAPVRLLIDSDRVDWRGVAEIKYRVLADVFTVFDQRLDSKNDAFAAFCDSAPPELNQFCDFEASHNPFGGGCSSNPRFHAFVQWLTQCQLEFCQSFAKARGLRVGLMGDMPVGATGGGHEVSSARTLFVDGADIGAPPDPFSDTGQNWGMPPMNPARLRRASYEHFVSLIRSAMHGVGALRLDHAMWLSRVWWNFKDANGQTVGTYVYQNAEALLSLLALESHLNQCQIVAEDLGVVPDSFRDLMRKFGLLGNSLWYFETDNQNSLLPPECHRSDAVMMITNHDVPTLAAWWRGRDIELRLAFGLIDEPSCARQLEERGLQREQTLTLLGDRGLLIDEEDPVDLPGLTKAVIALSAQGESPWIFLQLEDLLGVEDPVNVPGTYLEYNNWTRKLPVVVDLETWSEEWAVWFQRLSDYRAR